MDTEPTGPQYVQQVDAAEGKLAEEKIPKVSRGRSSERRGPDRANRKRIVSTKGSYRPLSRTDVDDDDDDDPASIDFTRPEVSKLIEKWSRNWPKLSGIQRWRGINPVRAGIVQLKTMQNAKTKIALKK